MGHHVRDLRRRLPLLRREVYVLAPSPSPLPPLPPPVRAPPATGQEEYHWLLFSPRALPGSGAGGSRGKAKEAEETEGGCDDEVHPCYITPLSHQREPLRPHHARLRALQLRDPSAESGRRVRHDGPDCLRRGGAHAEGVNGCEVYLFRVCVWGGGVGGEALGGGLTGGKKCWFYSLEYGGRGGGGGVLGGSHTVGKKCEFYSLE